ncbi:MAG: hypothetical protein MZU95_14285 [Desulfomicrobium escambiense]|nr:hypothetical protein [Desulfomicrobium escambiense]
MLPASVLGTADRLDLDQRGRHLDRRRRCPPGLRHVRHDGHPDRHDRRRNPRLHHHRRRRTDQARRHWFFKKPKTRSCSPASATASRPT